LVAVGCRWSPVSAPATYLWWFKKREASKRVLKTRWQRWDQPPRRSRAAGAGWLAQQFLPRR